MGKKFAVILAGSGSKDGSEIHESALALYAISAAGCSYDIFAPDREQADVLNFITGEQLPERRNIMVEAARIARGRIAPLSSLNPSDYDILLIPGGFGTAKNLFTFAYDGIENMRVYPDVEAVILGFNRLGRPIGCMCVAPVMLARIFAGCRLAMTLGPASELTANIEKLYGSKLTSVAADEIVSDSSLKIVTVPCYMYDDATIAQIGRGAERMVVELIRLSE